MAAPGEPSAPEGSDPPIETAVPPHPSGGPRRRPWHLVAVGAVLLALAGGAAAIVLSSGKDAKPATTSSSDHPASSSTATAPRPSVRVAPISRAQAVALLDEYAAAYSAESVSRLNALFAPNFVRRNGDEPTKGRSAALVEYAKQFAGLQGARYRLSLVAFAAGGDIATAVARYSITTAAGTVTGAIQFQLVRHGDGVLITKVVTHPSGSAAPSPTAPTPTPTPTPSPTPTPAPTTPAQPSSPSAYANTCRVKAWYSGGGFSQNYGYIHFKCVDESSGTTVDEALGSDNFDFRAESQAAKRTAKRVALVDQLRSKLESAGWHAIGSVSGGEWYQLRFGR